MSYLLIAASLLVFLTLWSRLPEARSIEPRPRAASSKPVVSAREPVTVQVRYSRVCPSRGISRITQRWVKALQVDRLTSADIESLRREAEKQGSALVGLEIEG
jgi:hypothetical protein